MKLESFTLLLKTGRDHLLALKSLLETLDVATAEQREDAALTGGPLDAVGSF